MFKPIPIYVEDDVRCNFAFRILESIVCILCLLAFIVLLCLSPILRYIMAITLTIAALTIIPPSVSLFIMAKTRKRPQIYLWLFIVSASVIGYIVCLILIIIQPLIFDAWVIFPSLVLSCAAIIIFLLDLILLLRFILGQPKKKTTRMNQITPVRSVGIQQSQEQLRSTEVGDTIECSVIVDDQLTCNQQLCHVKWSGDQASFSSTPTPKLIYVQPCTSTFVNKICPACKKFNCKQCFQNEKNETNMDSILESQSTIKSTQFPNDNKNICSICTFKPVKEFKTGYTQTLEEQVYYSNKSSCTNIESQMVCPKCRRISEFILNQKCANILTCTTCYQDLPACELKHLCEKPIKCQPESIKNNPESANKMTQVMFTNNMSTQVSSKEFIEKDFVTYRENISTQVSSKEFIEKDSIISSKNISTQVSSKEFIQEQHSCPCFKNEVKSSKTKKCDVEIQVSLGSSKYVPLVHFKSNENKATNTSKYEFKEERELIILGQTGTQTIYVNKLFENHKSTNEMSDHELIVEEINENKKTQVSSNDFVQKLCGASNCQHPKCRRVIYGTHNVDEMVQTEVPITKMKKNPEYVDQGTITEQFKQISCQTAISSEKSSSRPISASTEKERNEDLPTDLPECVDPNCSCVINENEIYVCAYCKSMLHACSTDKNDIVEIPNVHDCKCDLPNCICCKKQQSPKKEKCFCIKTEKGLLICTICEVTNKERAQETVEYKQMDSQTNEKETTEQSTQIGNERKKSKERTESKERTKSKERKGSSENEEDKQVIYKAGKCENEDKEVDYASSTSISESIPFDTDDKNKKSGHAMSFYLSNKPEATTNITVFTLQNNVEKLEIADREEDEENEERKKIEWDALAKTYQEKIRKNVKPKIIFNADVLDNAQSEMQNIYNSMIKNLVERQIQKENNLKFLERLNCNCDLDDNCSKYDAGHSTRNEYNYDDVLLKIKESNSSTDQSLIISMSDNLSLSTITEEINMTSSDLISTSKESESDIKLAKSIDYQTVKPKETKKYCPKSCVFTAEKCTRKSAGFFEPCIFSPTHESTKTSLSTSDNESTVDSINNIKTPGSCVSFNLQEDPSLKEETLQSLSVPITSRSRSDKPHVLSCVRKHSHSIPCTPKYLQSQSTDVSRKNDTNIYRKYNKNNEISSRIALVPEIKDNDFKVPPLQIANITPELSLSDSEDSRPISCSSHISAMTLQTIDNYNLECHSLYKNPNLMRLQEMKKSRKSLGLKSEPLTKRPFDEKQLTGRNVAFNMKSLVKPTIRERRISAPPRSQRISSPKSSKVKSATSSVRTFRQKKATINSSKSLEKKKSSAKKSKIKSEPVSPEHVCHCDIYKKSKNKYCKMHPKIKSVPVSHRSNNPSCSKQIAPTIISIISPEMSPKKMLITLTERAKTWSESPRELAKNHETTPKNKDT